ncbi:MAG: hypothetical protein ACRDN0_07240 [Trebonia sp.]
MAIDGDGNALTWDDTSWTAPRLVDPDGGGLTAVSCAPDGRCVAADYDGQTVSFGG